MNASDQDHDAPSAARVLDQFVGERDLRKWKSLADLEPGPPRGECGIHLLGRCSELRGPAFRTATDDAPRAGELITRLRDGPRFSAEGIATLNVRDDATVRKEPCRFPDDFDVGEATFWSHREESGSRPIPITLNAHAVSLSNVAWSKDLIPWRGLTQASAACPCGLTEVRRGRDCGFRRRGHCETARPSR